MTSSPDSHSARQRAERLLDSLVERPNLAHGISGKRRAQDAARIHERLATRGRLYLRVHGTSMLPWMRPGDILMIRAAKIETLRCGQVVLFRRNAHLFVHRIVEKQDQLGTVQIIVKGDAHPTSDGPLEPQELLGRVVWLYRNSQRIDLEAPAQLALALFISQLSLHSRFWYPLARFAAIMTRPARRAMQALRVSNTTAR